LVHISLPNDQTIKIARGQQPRQCQRVRPFQRNLPLNRNIPHGNTIDQPIIFSRRIAIACWHIHMIIDTSRGQTGLTARLKKRAFANPRTNG